MRQIAGASVVLAVAVAAMRLAGGPQSTPAGPASKPAGHSEKGKPPAPAPLLADDYQSGCSVFYPEDPSDTYPRDANRGVAKSVIDHFFALKDADGSHAASGTADARSGTLKDKTGIRYVVALAPDPRHTNLSLLFDREMVAIQQAAQDEGYNYNSSWLPWETESTSYTHIADEQRSEDLTEERESCPGILLFRKSIAESPPPGSPLGDSYDNALVVLIVGEQPTGGLNEPQWSNAIAFLRHNASVMEVAPPSAAGSDGKIEHGPLVERKLNILGPTFSGSLASLERDLVHLKSISPVSKAAKDDSAAPSVFPSPNSSIEVLGGSVRGCSAIRWFQKSLQSEFNGRAAFGSLEENDSLQIYNFLNYLAQQGAEISDVAILSEDETAYAYGYLPAAVPRDKTTQGAEAAGSCDFPYDLSNRPVSLSYPRDISALRSAYEKQSVFGGSTSRPAHPILDDGAELAGEPPGASDTIPSFGGSVNPVNQEAVLYGIVSNLRSHHSRYLLLRCTNPLDFLFLTRFFHRAYPEGRIITVGSDLLFRREIDTTEFRGVLALSSYSLLPRNQHWSHLSQAELQSRSIPHTHRIPESDQESEYLAARYLFDRRATQNLPQSLPGSNEPPLILPFKENLPDFADPFWLHKPGDPLTRLQAPTWLSVVGRDGYWPIAVLNPDTTPNKCLDQKPDKNNNPKSCPQLAPAGFTPPSTMVRIDGTQPSRPGAQSAHYDLERGQPAKFHKTILFQISRPWDICAILVCLLLGYQVYGITHGRDLTSFGIFALFRRIDTPSQGVLLGINCALALATLSTLLTVGLAVPDLEGALAPGLPLTIFGVFWPLWHVAFFYFLFRADAGKNGVAQSAFVLTVVISDIALIGSFSSGASAANILPLFYRMGHLTDGVSPLVPPLFLLFGFYLWTWQALAGNSMLCCGRPLLPEVQDPVFPSRARSVREYWNSRWYYKLLGLPTSASTPPPVNLLPTARYRISHEMGKRIVKIASPLCVDPKIVLFPCGLFVAAMLYFSLYGLPLVSLEDVAYNRCINFGLLVAFLLTIAEAARLFLTWKELQRMLTALSRLRLRRTFAKLRAIDSGSLWSVSGSVQRVQYHFFAQQLDAAKRLSRLSGGDMPSVVEACRYGTLFAAASAGRIGTGAVWEEPLIVPDTQAPVYIRQVLNDAVAEVLNKLEKHWEAETTSLCLEAAADLKPEPGPKEGEKEPKSHEMELAEELIVRTEEEFVCFHYIAFIQNILARMRTMVLSMTFLFVSVCFSISFYPFVPRTGISMWMMVNLLLIASAVVYVYAGLERDETLSYITSTPPGSLGTEFYLKTAAFLAGPLIGLLTTQFPSISESFLSWLQPGLDALK